METGTRTPVLGKKEAAERLRLQQEAATAPLRWRTRRLNSPQAIRVYLSDLVNRIEAGRVDSQQATRTASICQVALQAMKLDEMAALESRLAELERRLAEVVE